MRENPEPVAIIEECEGGYLVRMCGAQWWTGSPESVGQIVSSLLTQDRMAALLNGTQPVSYTQIIATDPETQEILNEIADDREA